MKALIWLSAANALFVIVSMISSWRIQTSKNHAENRILPNYKIKWYLDREYLRFKKTAKEIRIFNQEPKVLKLFEKADSQINTVKDDFDKTVLRQNIIIDGTKQLSDLSVYITFAVMALLGNIMNWHKLPELCMII